MSLLLQAQETTVGLLTFTDEAHDGYVLFSPIRSDFTYLVDACGQVVNAWEAMDQPRRMAYLNNEANLIRPTLQHVDCYDWDGNVVWQFDPQALNIQLHHDIAILPNNNILFLAIDTIHQNDLIEIGRQEDRIDQFLLSEKIIEVSVDEDGMPEVVWEWYLVDHIIQDVDPSKPNFSEIDQNPNRLDINYVYQNDLRDYVHFNSIAYSESLDQIILSARHTSEIYIIDHSTSTAEAATSQGGNAGKGGDFLFRWGNDKVFNSDSNVERKLFGQHDANWVQINEDGSHEIALFNNGDQREGDYSSVHILNVSPDSNFQYPMTGSSFAPADFSWSFEGALLQDTLYSFIEGGFTKSENGHVLISESSSGIMYEISSGGTVHWAYRNPVHVFTLDQGDDISFGPDYFKLAFYPSSFVGFNGLDLTPTGTIENENLITEDCIISTRIEDEKIHDISIWPNPTSDKVFIQKGNADQFECTVLDLLGNTVKKVQAKNHLSLEELPNGLYVLMIKMGTTQFKSKVLKI